MPTQTFPGTLKMTSKNRFVASFTKEDGLEHFFTATIVPDIPMFTTKNVKLHCEDLELLAATHSYSGGISKSQFKFIADNGPVIEGEIDEPPRGLFETKNPASTRQSTVFRSPMSDSTIILAIEDSQQKHFLLTINTAMRSQPVVNISCVTTPQDSESGFVWTRDLDCSAGELQLNFTMNNENGPTTDIAEASSSASDDDAWFSVTGAGNWMESSMTGNRPDKKTFE